MNNADLYKKMSINDLIKGLIESSKCRGFSASEWGIKHYDEQIQDHSTELFNRISVLTELIKELAPKTRSLVIDPDFDRYCFYCNATSMHHDGDIEHHMNCPWLRAQEVLNNEHNTNE